MVEGDIAKLVRNARTSLERLWPSMHKIMYNAKYHSGKKEGKWIMMSFMEALRIVALSREASSEGSMSGTTYTEDLVFVKDHFELVRLEQKWDKREGRSSKESFRNKALDDEALFKLLKDRKIKNAFVKRINEIKEKS